MCDDAAFGPRDAVIVAALVVAAAAAICGIRTGRHRAEMAAVSVLTMQSAVGAIRGRGHTHHTFVRPAITGVATVVLLWHGRKQFRAAAILHAVSVAVGIYLIDPCSNQSWAAAVDASVGPLLAVVAWSAGGAWPAAAAAEAIAIVVLIAAHSDDKIASMASHLTWWSIASVAVVDIATFADWLTGRSVTRVIVPTAVILTHTVVVGVVVMSGMGCTMLVDAFHDAGVGGYIAGNFLMHYYPAIRTAWAPADYATGGAAAAKAAAIVAVYGIAFAPPHVYGCPWPPLGYAAVLLVGVACAVVVTAAIYMRVLSRIRKTA